jgi:tRNA(Ile)-lysidine synthase
MNTWQSLEFRVQRELSGIPLQGRRLVLGFSGGADSTALLMVLKNISSSLGFSLVAVHCHHGRSENQEFRDLSASFTRALCADLGVDYRFQENANLQLRSEEELRDFRKSCIGEVAASYGADALQVYAHHQDDLLETRLLRLIRGTGLQGLQAMELYHDRVLRPFLSVSRKEIEEYLALKEQKYLSDPSQIDLRNFVRQEWLPLLENRYPGAAKSLARSLELILATTENFNPSGLTSESQINQNQFLCLSVTQQTQVLAQYISSLGVKNYTRGQIKEILKHLDRPQREQSFVLAGLRWDIDAKNIRASRV